MKFSTRSRYALRVLADLAEHRNGNFLPLKEIAERQEISRKYLEGIMADLAKSGIVEGQHGKGGGYRLGRDPASVTLLEVLRVTEGELAPVSCLGESCPRAASCATLPVWTEFYRMETAFFGERTVADLVCRAGGDFVI